MSTNYAVPTGEFIAEWLDENGMSQADLARSLNVSRKHVSQLVSGQAVLTHPVAQDLELVTGVPARIWMNYENQYRLDVARLAKDETLSDRLSDLTQFPLAYLRKRGFLTAPAGQPAETVREVLHFFGIADVDTLLKLPQHTVAGFKQSQAYQINDYAVATWIRVGAHAVNSRGEMEYDAASLYGAIPKLRALTTLPEDEFLAETVRICADVGVTVIFDAGPDATRCSGVTHWVGPNPVVQLSGRGKKNDLFWFAFFHELGHVLLHPHDRLFIEGKEAEGPLEAEADQFARDTLIPPSDWLRRPRRKSLVALRQFALEVGVHPGIVIGRVQHETRDFTWGNALKQTIRTIE